MTISPLAGKPAPKEMLEIYAESFEDERHLQAILADAQRIISDA